MNERPTGAGDRETDLGLGGRLSRLLLKHTVLIVVILVGVGVVTSIQVFRISARLREEAVLGHAASYAGVIREFRTLYTSEVVVRTRGKIRATHDYQDHPGTIPLPATFSIALGERLGQHADGMEVHLYSDYPFPWRERTGGLRDDFRKKAWDALRANQEEPFYRIEQYAGRSALRYATADLMRPACVRCHNTHESTPKDDWQDGDVRGVLEVIIPMDSAEASASAELLLAGALGLICLVGFAILLFRLRRESRVIDESNLALETQKQALSTLLDNMQQAVFAIDATQRIVPPVSRHSAQVLRTDIEGRDVLEVVYGSLPATGEVLSRVRTALAVVFGEGELQWELMEDSLPKRVVYRAPPTSGSPSSGHDEYRVLRVAHSPIWNEDGCLEKILYVIEDITDLEALEREVSEQKEAAARNLRRLQELADVPPDQLEIFFRQALNMIDLAERRR